MLKQTNNHFNLYLTFICVISSQIKIGIVYFKGDNILKDSKGLYKIADFGLSKRCNIDSASGGYCLMTPGVGTPTHMAPELKDPTLNVPYDMNMMKVDIW